MALSGKLNQEVWPLHCSHDDRYVVSFRDFDGEVSSLLGSTSSEIRAQQLQQSRTRRT